MFTEEKLNKIREGVTINMKKIKLWAEIINRQSANTWVHIKSNNNSIIDIRNVFRKFSLRVNRIIRVSYGPYRLGILKNPGDITEAPVEKSISSYMFYRYKDKMQSAVRKLDETKLELIKERFVTQQRKGIVNSGVSQVEDKDDSIKKLNRIKY